MVRVLLVGLETLSELPCFDDSRKRSLAEHSTCLAIRNLM